MKEEFIEESDKKHTIRILFYLFLFVGFNLVMWGMFIKNFQSGSLSNINPREIIPGTNLIYYEGKKVSCTFHFVVANITNYNSENNDALGTDGLAYLVLDDNLSNPFIVNVEAKDSIKMDAMVEETKKVMAGDVQFHPAGSITIKGFVEKCPNKDSFINAIKENYDKYEVVNTDVYYIGDANLANNKKYNTKIILILISYLILFGTDMIIIISSLKNCFDFLINENEYD